MLKILHIGQGIAHPPEAGRQVLFGLICVKALTGNRSATLAAPVTRGIFHPAPTGPTQRVAPAPLTTCGDYLDNLALSLERQAFAWHGYVPQAEDNT